MSKFNHLLSPGRIGSLELRNRIVMAPMGSGYGSEDGRVTDRMMAWYEERAKGGVGLIIAGVVLVDHPRGATEPGQIGISDDRFLPGLTELAHTVRGHGAKIALQLHHGGRLSSSLTAGGNPPVASSPVPLYEGAETPRELSGEEIGKIVEVYAQAAERARKAGIDGIEIHAGHGYLIDGFLSRHDNKREDRYGGTMENRARFLIEIIRAIRDRVGDDYPLWVRINGQTFGIEEGTTLEEARETAQMAERAGVDALHVSGYGGSLGAGFTEAPLVYRPGNLLPAAQAIREAVSVPVIAVGRISPELGEKALMQDKADFIAMGRPLLADPNLPGKLARGKRRDIRPCINCYTCVDQNFYQRPIICAVNPAMGREASFNLGPVAQPRRVMIVGGGPAGMEAARVAALRGHHVTLYEKQARLGGSLFFASVVRKDYEGLIEYFARELRRLGVAVRFREEATPELVQQQKPDSVVVATGPSYPTVSIPGVERKNVLGSDELRAMLNGRGSHSKLPKRGASQRLLMALSGTIPGRLLTPSMVRQLTRCWMPLGRRVVIIGADMVGCELAEFLAERGRKVTVVESGKRWAPEMAIPLRWMLRDRMDSRGIELLRQVTYEQIGTRSVTITDGDGTRRTIGADTVILAPGVQPNLSLSDALRAGGLEPYVAGDCVELRLISGSIADGAEVAIKV